MVKVVSWDRNLVRDSWEFIEFEAMAEKSSGVTLYAIGNGHLGASSGRHRYL